MLAVRYVFVPTSRSNKFESSFLSNQTCTRVAFRGLNSLLKIQSLGFAIS